MLACIKRNMKGLTLEVTCGRNAAGMEGTQSAALGRHVDRKVRQLVIQAKLTVCQDYLKESGIAGTDSTLPSLKINEID